MKETEKKFDLDDIAIVPAVVSNISSRSECNTDTRFGNLHKLPLMASPMDTVVCRDNLQRYINEGIIPCMPRGQKSSNNINRISYFQAFGLSEIEFQLYSDDTDKDYFYKYPNVLIDIANGHMQKLVDIVKEIKSKFPDINLMVGNVAHPLTYKSLALAGADYVRCSIGTGAGCTTAANVAINYPMGSLIHECRIIKEESGLTAKIVADGGTRDYADIIKALALGADYIMIGSIFNKSMESAGFNYLKTFLGKIRIKNYDFARLMWKWGFPIYKKYRGMSTKSVQRSWGRTRLVTAEGITKYQKVGYTLHQWVENFDDYLSSNMSYSGDRNLEDFIGKADWVFITDKARKRFEK
jgi:GMP reductase